MTSNAIVGQSGGPTAAINATLAGVIDALLKSEKIGKVYGAVNGIEGILHQNIKELNPIFLDKANIGLLKNTPSAYLGSCRYKLPAGDAKTFETLFQIFKKKHIAYFFYIGGNDSMDTVMQLSDYAKKTGQDIKIIGVPKTIDNDLWGTDHCPGFGSAAKYVATSVAEIARDAYCYDTDSVTIVEIMGRNAGWLTAASALARSETLSAPDLIYLPEIPFSTEAFFADLEKLHAKKKNIVVAISEGIRDKDGNYIAADHKKTTDQFGHAQLGGAGKTLEAAVKEQFGCKCRSVELSVLQRCASHFAASTDINESFKIGAAAVKAAFKGKTGEMMVFKRADSKNYRVTIGTMDIAQIANKEKKVPRAFISRGKNGVTQAFLDYARPLILGEAKISIKDGLPMHLVLKK